MSGVQAGWTEQSILVRLKEVAQEQLNLSPEQVAAIQLDSPLVETLRLDSLAQVVLVTAVENDFGCTFELEEWQRLNTVQDLLTMIAKRLAAEQKA